MVLSLILLGAAIPTVFATTESVRQSQNQSKANARARTCRLTATASTNLPFANEVNNKIVVLLKNKLYLADPSILTGPKTAGHPFLGHYRAFPETNFFGLVSTIQDEPPMLNWIYVDKHTLEVKYGAKKDTIGHIVGPFDWTSDRRCIVLDGWEGFVAVEEDVPTGGSEGEAVTEAGGEATKGGAEKMWALYFDWNDDGKMLPQGSNVVEVSLVRQKYT